MADQPNTTRDDQGSNETHSSSCSPRSCGRCGQPIPQQRLTAHPNARLCVPCLEAMGDVPRIRRFDEYTPDGHKIETYFDPTQDSANMIKRVMTRMNRAVPSDNAFDIAVGDDSHLVREGNRVMDVARPLATEFEVDEENATLIERACGIASDFAVVDIEAA